MSPALIWLIAGIVLILAEFFMPGFVIAFFGLGALVAAVTTSLGLTTGVVLQTVVFLVVAVASLFLLRRYVKNVFGGKTEGQGLDEFNVDIGRVVKVIEDIDANQGTGRVQYQGAPWKATAAEPIPAGQSVRITGKNNITLTVEKVV